MKEYKNRIDEALNRIARKSQIVIHMLERGSIKVEVGQEWDDPEIATGVKAKQITSHYSNDESTIVAADGFVGTRMEAHYHNSQELIVCAKGSMRVNVAGKEVILGLLDSIRIPAGTVHSFEFLEDCLAFMVWAPKFPEIPA